MEAFHEPFAPFSFLLNAFFDGISALEDHEAKDNIFAGSDTKEDPG